jgi:ABC-2 type transport system ATP-binding protein
VVIIHQGRVVAQDTPTRLREQVEGKGRVVVEVRGAGPPEIVAALGRVAGVRQASLLDENAAGPAVRVALEVVLDRDVREDVFRAVVAAGWTLTELRADRLSLEDIFVRITTRETEGGASGPGGQRVAA